MIKMRNANVSYLLKFIAAISTLGDATTNFQSTLQETPQSYFQMNIIGFL